MKTRLDFVSNSSSSSYIVSVEDNPHMMVLDDPVIYTLEELVAKFGRRLFMPDWWYSNYNCTLEVDDSKFIELFLSDKIIDDYALVKNDNSAVVHLPHDALKPYELYCALKHEHNSTAFHEMHSMLHHHKCSGSYLYTDSDKLYDDLASAAENAMFKACTRALSVKLKDMHFCYQEIEDNYRGSILEYDPFKMSIDPDKPSRRSKKLVNTEDVMHDRKMRTFYETLDGYESDECLVVSRIRLLEQLRGPMKFKRIYSNH